MSKKRQVSPSGASRAFKQSKLYFGKKMATSSEDQPQSGMTIKENKALETAGGSKSGDGVVVDKHDSDDKSSAADAMCVNPTSGAFPI